MTCQREFKLQGNMPIYQGHFLNLLKYFFIFIFLQNIDFVLSIPLSILRAMTLTCVVWRARLNTHWLRGRRGSGVGGCSRCRYCCCGQSQFLLLGLAGLQGIPLFHLLVKQLIVFLNIVLQVWGQFVHATEYLSCFLIKLLCIENRQIIIMCSLFVKNTDVLHNKS